MEKIDSILTSVKKSLGIEESYEHFDPDIIMHINTVFDTLAQLGVGNGFSIEDKSTTWDEFIPGGYNLNMVQSYMFLKVKMLFDPPQGSVIMNSMEKAISEFEWRLNVEVDPGKGE